MSNPPVVAVLASGSGTTFRAVTDAIHAGSVDFQIGLVITDRENAGVLDQVDAVNSLYGFSIESVVINAKRYPGGPQKRGQTIEEAEAVCHMLNTHRIDHLTLMGFMRICGQKIVEEYGWKPQYALEDPIHKGVYQARMTNTHPGILPATADTYGLRTQQKVLDLGLAETAHTFHVVSVGVDEGPTIAEHRVPVTPGDTPESLFARVRTVEKQHLPLDLDIFLKDQQIYLKKEKV